MPNSPARSPFPCTPVRSNVIPFAPVSRCLPAESLIIRDVDRITEVGLDAFPTMNTIAVLIEGPPRIVGARDGANANVSAHLLLLQNSFAASLALCAPDQFAHIDFSENSRQWPALSRQGSHLGFRSIHVIPLCVDGSVIGLLSAFCRDNSVLTGPDLRRAKALIHRAMQGRVTLGDGRW